MKPLFRFLAAAAFRAGLAVLFAAAVALGLLRLWLLPHIADFREPIATRLGELLGEPLRIEDISARLRGFHPELTLRGLHLLDAQGRTVLRLATARASLDPFRSLAAREPRFDRVEIVGPHVALRRLADGSLAVLGLSGQGGEPPGWLLADGHFALLDAELDYQDERTATPPLALGRVDLHLRNQQDRHRLDAAVALPDGLGQKLRLAVDATGDGFDPARWRGWVYLEGQGLDAARLAACLPPAAFGLRAGRLDAKLWLRWQGAPQRLAGEFGLAAPTLFQAHPNGAEHQLALKSLGARFAWRPGEHGWRLDIDRLRPVLRQPWPDTRLAVAVERRDDGALASLAATASYVNLGDIATVLHALPGLLPDSVSAPRPPAVSGVLENARLFHAPTAPPGERWGFRGRFRDITLPAWRSLPALTGFGGEFHGTDAAGQATLAVADGSATLGGLGLAGPVRLHPLRAELRWAQTAESWTFTLASLALRNADLDLRGRARVVLPKPAGASPFVDFQARLGPMDITAVPRYLPCGLIPVTCEWAGPAFLSGRVLRGEVLFRGLVADFPFYRDEGVLQADVDTENVKLRYSPDWPLLTHTAAHLAFRGPGLSIDSHRGRIGAGRIVQVHARIPDLNQDHPHLELTGTARAQVAEGMDFLAHSPLRNIPDRLLRHVGVSGDSDIMLDLTVPFDSQHGDTRAQGTARLRQAGLHINDLDLDIADIDGDLRFSGEGIQADALRARILERPATVDVNPDGDEVVIDARGSAEMAVLRRQFPAEIWRHARGATDYHARLRLPESLDAHSAPLRLALDSSLAGLALDLPAPLGKPDTPARPLTVETSFQAGQPLPVRLDYGPDIAIRARFSAPEQGAHLERADFALGEPLPPPGGEPGLGVYARLETLDAGAWRRWQADTAAGTGDGEIPPLRELRAHIGKLAWNGTDLGPFALDLQGHGQRWIGHIDSDHGKGWFAAGPDAIRANLDTLRLPKPAATSAPPTAAAQPEPDPPGPDIDPARVPSLHLRARHLQWGDANLGPLSLDTERHAHGMIVKALNLAAANHRLALRGQWTRSPTREAATHLEGQLHIDNLGRLLAQLGHDGQVRDTSSELDFGLDWPGSPRQFAPATVAGEVRVKLGKGSLPRIEPGLGRMIGMLNLDSVWRRLNLDFSDLFGAGLAYEGMGGTFHLGRGLAVTEGFWVDALSAKIIVGGRVGLTDHKLDQVVTVIPHTSVALPIVGGLAGGPAVGAAVFVAQRLVGEQVDQLVASHYALQGPWDAPSITRINHYLPLDMLDRAWHGVKGLSGLVPGRKPPPAGP